MINMNFSLAFRFKTQSGDFVLVPQYVNDSKTEYETIFGNHSFQNALTSVRDAFGFSIESKVSEMVGEPVVYAGEFGGVIKTEGRLILGFNDA